MSSVTSPHHGTRRCLAGRSEAQAHQKQCSQRQGARHRSPMMAPKVVVYAASSKGTLLAQAARALPRICCQMETNAGVLTTPASAATSSAAGVSTASSSAAAARMTLPEGQQPMYGSIPAPPLEPSPIWSQRVWGQALEERRRIFCNRSLNMYQIKAVGFDMDYTLAQYKPETFEVLAHKQTVEKLVTAFGYPSLLYDLPFDWRYMTRGLIIDKKRGNILKIDRHKYVKVAYHGFRPMSPDERNMHYNRAGVPDEFDEPDYCMIDTLFSLAEAHLFMSLVEVADQQPDKLPNFKGYPGLYRDVRSAVDLCHRDGSLKREVAAYPEKYIHADPQLASMLAMYKRSGRKIFLATNSLWDFTNVVMNFLLSGRQGRDKNEDWLRYFDVVITGCAKPGFFCERRPLFAVDPESGMLQNTDNGAPIIPIGEDDLPAEGLGSSALTVDLADDDAALVFQGGNYVDLHKMLGINSGSEVLYVGDHIYGDILRSKKSLGWRTMLVVPELEAELALATDHAPLQRELRLLRAARSDLDNRIQRLEWAFNHQEVPAGSFEQNTEALAALRLQRERVKAEHTALLKEHHDTFHPVWGQLLKTGWQTSRYAHQMDRFACLYSSHVSNLAYYSPDHMYGGKVDYMAHEEPLGQEAALAVGQDDSEDGWGSDDGTGGNGGGGNGVEPSHGAASTGPGTK